MFVYLKLQSLQFSQIYIVIKTAQEAIQLELNARRIYFKYKGHIRSIVCVVYEKKGWEKASQLED